MQNIQAQIYVLFPGEGIISPAGSLFTIQQEGEGQGQGWDRMRLPFTVR